MPRLPFVSALAIDWGMPGTTIRTAAIGANLSAVTAVRFSGRGVTARVLAGRETRLELAITIAPDAAPGPRVVQAAGLALFHVRAPGSAGGAFGIGAQLI
ncbi:MAG: hypothetical protein IT555_12265 [Acetobacteraceae bacterium]|nr:hypothetical protein [Acetobacteraceae bacterium]